MADRAIAPLPQYRRADEPTRVGRAISLVGKLALAAGYGALVVMLPPQRLFLIAIPIVVLLLLTLWMLPDRREYSLPAISGLFFPLLITQVVWPPYLAVDLPGLPWMTPTRLLLFALTATFLYSVATSSVLRTRLVEIGSSARSIWILFLVWEVMQVITIPVSGNIGASAKKALDNQFELTGLFFAGCIVFSQVGWATKVSRCLILLAVICSVDGLIEQSMGMPPWANHIPGFLKVDEATLANVLGSQARSADGIYRVRGPFTNSLICAEFLAVCMPFLLHWLVTGRSVAIRVSLVVAWVLVLTGILITTSRLGLMGFLIAHVVYLGLWAYRKWLTDTGTMFGPAALLGTPVAIVLAVGLILSSTTLSNRFLGGGAQQASDESRRVQRQMAIPKVAKNPFGHGLATSGTTLGFVSPSGKITVDNHYITTALDLGVVGLVSFYGMWLAAAVVAARVYLASDDPETDLAAPLAAVFLSFLVIKSVLSQEDNHPLMFMLLGMTLALKARANERAAAIDAAVPAAATTVPGRQRGLTGPQRA